MCVCVVCVFELQSKYIKGLIERHETRVGKTVMDCMHPRSTGARHALVTHSVFLVRPFLSDQVLGTSMSLPCSFSGHASIHSFRTYRTWTSPKPSGAFHHSLGPEEVGVQHLEASGENRRALGHHRGIITTKASCHQALRHFIFVIASET